jgi:predicted TIM-barrel enzyme
LAVARERAFPPNATRRDLIFIYNSGRYRVAGRVSLAGVLAHRNASEIVRDMAREVLAVVKHSPVLADVNGTDPFCLFDPFLDDLKRLGFSGVQNFPMVGLTTESSAPIQKR